MLVFRKEILAMISNELNKRLVNYGQAVDRVQAMEQRLDNFAIRLQTVEQVAKHVNVPQGGLPVRSDKRIAELRAELAKHKHEVNCIRTKLHALGVRDV